MSTTNSQQYSSESGAGLVMFLVVGLVLLALAGGGLFLAQKRGQLAAADSGSSQVATDTKVDPDKPANSSNSSDTKKDTAKKTDNPSPAPKPQSSDSDSSNKPSQPAATPAPSTPAQAGQGSGSSSDAKPAQVAATGPSALPSTGLADNIATAALGVAALTLGATAYSRSRRRFITSARKL